MDYKHTYIKEIFARADIQQIREFLIAGVDLDETDERTYGERLEESSRQIVRRIKDSAKDDDELDRIYCEYSESTGEYMAVFLEVGLKVGARLMFQLLNDS